MSDAKFARVGWFILDDFPMTDDVMPLTRQTVRWIAYGLLRDARMYLLDGLGYTDDAMADQENTASPTTWYRILVKAEREVLKELEANEPRYR